MTDEWEIRIKASQDASSRSRYAYLASTIVSIAFLVVTFNYSLSWGRFTSKIPVTEVVAGTPPLPCTFINAHVSTAECDAALERLHELEKEYVQNQTIKNAVLGITVHNDDAPLVGSLAILIMLTWFYLCMKKEQRVIFRLLTDVSRANEKSLFRAVYHGIASYLVFNNIAADDFPILNLKGDQRLGEFIIVRFIYRTVLYFPVIAIAFILIASGLSLFVPSNLRLGDALWLRLSLEEKVQAGIYLVVSCSSLILAYAICQTLAQFDQGTKRMLDEFYQLLPSYVTKSDNNESHSALR